MATDQTAQAPQGLVSKTLAWALHPTFADTDPWDWFAFVVLAVIIAILWSRVVKQILE